MVYNSLFTHIVSQGGWVDQGLCVSLPPGHFPLKRQSSDPASASSLFPSLRLDWRLPTAPRSLEQSGKANVPKVIGDIYLAAGSCHQVFRVQIYRIH
jgi:hypothetical protein